MSKMRRKFIGNCSMVIAVCSLIFASCGTTSNAADNEKSDQSVQSEKSAGAAKSTKNNKSAGAAPDWVLSGTSEKYPKSAFVTGIGRADDKKSAELEAINELVAVFGQKVTSASNASRRMEMAQNRGEVASSDSASLDQNILREINQDDVIAVELPEFFESKKESKWYALAVMSREKGTQIYSSMIQKNQAEIDSILNQIKNAKDPNTLQNFSRLDFAEEVAAVNEGYLKRLTVLNTPAAAKFALISTPVQIHKKKADMAAKIPICVKVESDSDGRIAKSFQEVMKKFGFNTTIGTNERYKITCKNHFTPRKSSDGKIDFCEFVSECALTDTFTGETIVPLALSGREGSQTYQNAESRAKQKISAKIKTDFAESFQKFLGDFETK